MEDAQTTHRISNLIALEDGRWMVAGDWVQFSGDLHLQSVAEEKTRLNRANTAARRVDSDIWILLSILSKLEWLQTRVRSGELDRFLWMQFAATDIESFLVQFRSLFDHLAALAAAAAAKAGCVPDTSFKRLLTWLSKQGNPGRLDADLSEVLASATWMLTLRTLRDGIVHGGEESLVIPDPDNILFQVGWLFTIDPPHIMHNENLADFRLFAALYMARLLALLEDAATPLRRLLQLRADEGRASSYHYGYGTLRSWLQILD